MHVDEWGIDLAVGAPHKCIGGPSSIAFVAVSPAAWSTHTKNSIFSYCTEIVKQVNYDGYDALLPFNDAKVLFLITN